jgi:hypothetical protein
VSTMINEGGSLTEVEDADDVGSMGMRMTHPPANLQ